MRPITLAETGSRIGSGEPAEKALAEFLDEFYGATSIIHAQSMLQEAPPPTGIDHVDALLGAVADYLSMQYLRQPGPGWSQEALRFLDRPFFTTPIDSDAAAQQPGRVQAPQYLYRGPTAAPEAVGTARLEGARPSRR